MVKVPPFWRKVRKKIEFRRRPRENGIGQPKLGGKAYRVTIQLYWKRKIFRSRPWPHLILYIRNEIRDGKIKEREKGDKVGGKKVEQ